MVDVRRSVVVSPLSPELVAAAEFGNSFRGFDPSQVRAFLGRVAEELRAWHDREGALTAQVADLERRVAEATAPRSRALDEPIDEHRLTELLGAETARVLEVAREAASLLRANAEEQAAATVAAAEADAMELRAQAEAVLDERAGAAEAEATRLLADAEADAARIRDEADGLREQAAADAERHRVDARDEGRRMVAEARAVRERILTDMARRRNVARQQLERLGAGRQRLLEAIEAVRRAVDSASGELNDAVVEAKMAGDRAARQVDVSAVPPMRELETEVELARDADLIDLEAIEREVTGASGFDEAVAAAEAEDQLDPGPIEVIALVGEATEGDAQVDEQVDEGAAEPADEVAAPAVDDDGPADPPTGAEVAEVTDQLAQVKSAAVARTAPNEDPSNDEEEPGSVAAAASPDQPTAGAEDGPGEASVRPAPARRRGFSHAVDDLFSRWKQDGGGPTEAVLVPGDAPADEDSDVNHDADDKADDKADADKADADDATAVDGGAAEEDGAAASDERGDGLTDRRVVIARQTRDAVLAGIARDLARHLKLALSDEQNLVLEHRRDDRSRQAKRADSELFAELDRSDRFEQAARRELIGALEAGWGAVRSGGDEHPQPDLLDPAVDEVCRMLIGPLRERLRRALDEATDGSPAGERVRNLYRETRTEQAGPLAEHGALLAFAIGQYAAAGQLPDRADVRVRWAFEDCVPDCYDNFLAGALALDASFPTEHHHPPAFPGCRCLLVVETGGAAAADDEGGRGHFPPTAV